MDMYNDQRQKIGTKTVTQGGGIQRPDGSFGNHIAMKFNPPPQQAQAPTQQQSQMFSNSFGTMGRGVNAQKLEYETPTEGMTSTENQSRIIRNLARKRNATMQLEYDKMNSNIYNQQQDRVSREFIADNQLKQNQSQYDKTYDQQWQQFDRELDATNMRAKQQYEYNQAVKNVMTPYQQQSLQQAEYNNRVKSFDEGSFKAMMPEDVADEISDRNYNIAKNQWLNTGKMPSFNKSGSWYDDDYTIGQTPQSQEQQMPQNQSTTNIDTGDKNAYEFWKAKLLNEQIMNQ